MDGQGFRSALVAGAVAAAFGMAAAGSASAGDGARGGERPTRALKVERAPGPVGHTHSEGAIERRLLASHNAERTRLGLAPLRWNPALAREAGQWAQVLGRRGQLEHAPQSARNGTGENLWMGTAGVWPVEQMMGMFLDERRHYRHASFPDISRTGNWADVGHYTQIVWRDTREVGCAVHTARGNDVLVCRYWPAGNVWGARAY